MYTLIGQFKGSKGNSQKAIAHTPKSRTFAASAHGLMTAHVTPDYDVVINGGGPVGMGLAIELGQRGVRTAVVEPRATPQGIPKGQNLTQRTTEHFHFWNCEAALRAAHPLPKDAGIGGITCYRTLLSEYHYHWLNRAKIGNYYFTSNARLPQYATEGVLRARASEIPEIDVYFGWAGRTLSQTEARVELTIAEPEGSGQKKIRGRYLVGADGSHSVVREGAGITETRSDHDRLMVLLVFTSEELHRLLQCYPGKAFYNILDPEYQGYWKFFGRVDHGKSWFFHAPVPFGTTKDNFDFRAFLHDAVGREFSLTFDYIGFWDLRVAFADRYRAGRVFLAGDAAHSHPPYGGYGVNTGLEDARNLGWKLAAALEGWGTDELLNSYEAERRPVFASTARDFIERYIKEDRAFLQRYSPEKDRAEFEERWANRNLDQAEVNAFEPNYEGSPICPVAGDATPSACGDHALQARTGHHLAPCALPDGRNIFAALGPGFTLLDLGEEGDSAAQFRDAAKKLRVPLDVAVDRSGTALDTYGHPLVLVRPDHYVAWAGDGGEAGAIVATAIADRS